MPGATVMVVRGGTVVGSATTRVAGTFELAAPDRGRLEVRVSIDGFRAEPVAIDGGAAAIDLGDVRLAVSALAESVIVSAAHADVPLSTTASSVTVITGEDLGARQIESLADALRLVPGVSVATAGRPGSQSSVFPRGGESDYSLLLVDGVPANAFGGGMDFAHVPIVNVERIEVVRGPQSALYGSNAIGAVIRVITKRGGPTSGAASVEGGAFHSVRTAASTSGSLRGWEWGGSVERLSSDGLDGHRTSDGDIVSNDDYERTAVAGGAGWATSGGAGVRADLQFVSDDRGAPGPFGSDPGGTFAGIDTTARGSNDRLLAAVSARTRPSGRIRGLIQVTHGRIDGTFGDPARLSESFSRRSAARGQVDFSLRPEAELSAGVEHLRERAGSTFITASGSRIPVERSATGFFAEARLHHASRLFVTAGVRAERITRDALPGNPGGFSPRPDFSDATVVSLNPKIAAAWFVRSEGSDYTKLRAAAGTGIRPPDGFEIAFTDNPGLKPERSRSVDAGIDQTLFDGRAIVEATAFFNDFDDLIVAVGSFAGSSRYRTDNISNARARGLELAATARVRLHAGRPIDLQARFAYTLLDTEILAVDQSDAAPPPFEPGDRLLRRPKHQFAADVDLQAGRLGLFLRGNGRSRALDVDPSFGTFGGLFESAGYGVWHAGGSWRMFDRVQLFARINNVFDRQYEEVLGYPALPRGAFAGIRVAAGR